MGPEGAPWAAKAYMPFVSEGKGVRGLGLQRETTQKEQTCKQSLLGPRKQWDTEGSRTALARILRVCHTDEAPSL